MNLSPEREALRIPEDERVTLQDVADQRTRQTGLAHFVSYEGNIGLDIWAEPPLMEVRK